MRTPEQTGLTGSALVRDGPIALVSHDGHVLVSAENGASFGSVPNLKPMPLGLARGEQALVVGGYRRVVAHGRQRGHVQRGSHLGATAPDAALPLALARIVGQRRNAHQLGDGLATQRTQLGQRPTAT